MTHNSDHALAEFVEVLTAHAHHHVRHCERVFFAVKDLDPANVVTYWRLKTQKIDALVAAGNEQAADHSLSDDEHHEVCISELRQKVNVATDLLSAFLSMVVLEKRLKKH